MFGDPVPVPVQPAQTQAQTQPVNPVQSKKNRDDSTNFQYVLELYEIGKTDFKANLFKQIPLMKDKDNAIVKPKYILKRASFVTNGKLMLMIHKR